MIKENVNGIATQIKKLYEYIDGTKQEIKERYELVNGRKELVFKNETINEIQLVDANGNPMNSVSGQSGMARRIIGSSGSNYAYGFTDTNNVGPSYKFTRWMTLGIASGKQIKSLRGTFRGYVRNSLAGYKPQGRIFYDNETTTRVYKEFIRNGDYYPPDFIIDSNAVTFNLTNINRTINRLVLDVRNVSTAGSESQTSTVWLGVSDVWVEYIE